MHSTREMQTAWAQYWRNGNFESLPKDQAGGLGALDSTWGEFFSALPDRARMLDLATGGGAVIRRAIAVGREFHRFRVSILPISLQLASRYRKSDSLEMPSFRTFHFRWLLSTRSPRNSASNTRSCHRCPRGSAGGGSWRPRTFRAASRRGRHYTGCCRQSGGGAGRVSGNNAFALGKAVFELRQRSAPQSEIVQAEGALRNAVAILQSRHTR